MASEPTTTNDAAVAATVESPKPAKPLTVIEGMDSRRMFDTTDDAANYLNASAEKFTDFNSHPQVLRGVITEGENAGDFDPAVYTDDMRVMVAVLANRGEKGKPSTTKAIIVTPAPKLDSLLADPAGKSWVAKIIDKELNHVAVRGLRTVDDVETVADQMPLTMADYITSSRESTGGIMETFDTLYKGIIAGLAAKSPAWSKARLIKTELKRAMESKAYALAYYPTLEDRGMNAKTNQPLPSLFVMALGLGEREAKNQGLDPAIFTKWLAERDSKQLTAKSATDDESDDFDLDSLAFVEEKTEDKSVDAAPTPAPDTTPAPATV